MNPMTTEQIARLYVIFKTLAPEIKEWIASDEASGIMRAMTERFVLSEEQGRMIPILILRLVTQDLAPESFKAELGKSLAIEENLAKGITEALAKEIIAPIASALRYARINTDLMGFNAPAPEHTAPKTTTPAPIPKTQQSESPAAPFVLHEEPRAETAPRVINTPHSNESDWRIAETEGRPAPRVMIERVVHYSNLRTPLNAAGITEKKIPDRAKPRLPQSKWFV
jgi:hypothetical protein